MSSTNNNKNHFNSKSTNKGRALDRRVVEDVPTMRSVMMTRPEPTTAMRGFPPALAKPNFPARTTVTTNTSKSSPPPMEGKNRKSWKVLDNRIPPLPVWYPLERTNVTITNATAQEIVDRIADCLRQESIAATFDDQETAVQAETRDHVQFAVHLFSNPEGMVTVEVQRRSGCSFQFHQCSKALLCAAQGTPTRSREAPKFVIPACVAQAAQRAEETELKCIESDLCIAFSLLESNRLDSQLMGMESLIHLSKTRRCQLVTAKKLLCCKCNQQKLFCFIDQVEAEEDGDDLGDFTADHLTLMHRHALTVLANCLESLLESGELMHVLNENDYLRSEMIMNRLIAALSTAKTAPHDAHEAARCLRSLVSVCPNVNQLAGDAGVSDAVALALDVGVARHALLEGSSRRLQHDCRMFS